MAASTLLKLRARDAEDMAVISTCLQDALVPLCDVAYLKAAKRFVMVANRFKWETAKNPEELSPAGVAAPGSDARFEDDSGTPAFERVHCGVRFDRVRAVQVRGLDLRNRDHILNLLAIEAAPRRITLVFSGDAFIRLDVGSITCHLEDLGEAWPTHWQPVHEGDDSSPADT